jgi:anti-sigma regulatory factor (Ser/Thr protein kinase)
VRENVSIARTGDARHDGVVTDGHDGVVRLELPIESKYIRVARLVASGLGATAGLDVDAVDDLRIAVDELCAALFEVGGQKVELTFAVDADQVEVTGSTETGSVAAFEPARLVLSRQILDVACDTYSLTLDGGYARFTMRKSTH